MKKALFILTCLIGAAAAIPAGECFFNGGFEENTFSEVKIKSSGACWVKTSYGRSLLLGKVVGGIEAAALPEAELPGSIGHDAKVFPYCIFALELNPKARYELTFDYMPGNIRNGGGVVILDSKGKLLNRAILPVNNLYWNSYSMPFRFPAGSDGKVSIKFFLHSAADLGGMAVDNISLRLRGDLLPRWGSGNILHGKGELPGWFWQVSGSEAVKCNGEGFAVKTSEAETVTLKVKTPCAIPDKEYFLRLGGKADKAAKVVAEIKFLDGQQREINNPAVFTLNCRSGKNFRKNWRFSLPEETMLIELSVKYQFEKNTVAAFETPRIFAAPQTGKNSGKERK